MRPGSYEHHSILFDTVDEKPIRFYVTLSACLLAKTFQGMVFVFGIERLGVSK